MNKKCKISVYSLMFVFSFVLVFSLLLVNADLGENENEWLPLNITTTGLTLEGVNTTFNPDGMNFQTSYLNLTLTPKEVFVPNNLSDKATVSGYTIQDAGYIKRITLTGLTYNQDEDYGNSDLNALLGRTESSGVDVSSAVAFEIYDAREQNQILYSYGDVVIYEEKYYVCIWASGIYNSNGLPTALTSYWEETSGSSGSIYPANYFQICAYVSDVVENEEDLSSVFDYDFKDLGDSGDYNVSWNINVSSHYNHLIINYELWFENSTTQDLVYTWEDVYTDDTTELLAVDYRINKYDDYSEGQIVDRAFMNYDNLYGEEKYVNVTIAYPKNKELLDFSASSNKIVGYIEDNHTDELFENISSISNFTEVENRYSNVTIKATNLGRTETLLENTENFTFKSYQVLVQSDSENTFYFKIPSEYGEYNDLRIWVEGSFAGGAGTSGDPYQIETWAQ